MSFCTDVISFVAAWHEDGIINVTEMTDRKLRQQERSFCLPLVHLKTPAISLSDDRRKKALENGKKLHINPSFISTEIHKIKAVYSLSKHGEY